MKRIFFLGFLASAFVSVFADDVPLSYNGYSLVSRDNSAMKIKSEKIEIIESQNNLFWVKAEYIFENPTTKTIQQKVGFPIGEVLTKDKYGLIGTLKLYLFKISQNKVLVAQKELIDTTTYGWNATFVPGINKINVEYKITSNLSVGDQKFYNIRYLLDAGTLGKTSIDSIAITVRMLKPIDKEQLINVVPNSWQLNGREISWKLLNERPTSFDNIEVQYISGNDFDKIKNLRNKIAADPSDDNAKLKLAVNYLQFIGYKGRLGSFPLKMSLKDNNAVLVNKASDKNKAVFNRYYNTKGDSIYFKYSQKSWPDSKLKSDSIRLLWGTLLEIGIRPDDGLAYINDAEQLLLQTIAETPNNAKAWNIYLANLHKFHWAGCYSPFQPGFMMDHQKSLIAKASLACPGDTGISILDKVSLDKKDIPTVVGKYNESTRGQKTTYRVFLEQSEFTSLSNNSAIILPKAELDVLLKYYKVNEKDLLVLRAPVKNTSDEKKLTDALDKLGYYHRQYPTSYSKYYFGRVMKGLK
jgi:hypothetical protein